MQPSDWALGPLPSDNSLTERVTASIKQLSLVATDLNKVSDELSQAIYAIDTVLQGLNIGVHTWITIHDDNDMPESEYFSRRDLGYSKVGGRWGISLRAVTGNYSRPDEESTDSWHFNDAPRWLRLEGIEKIPDLLDELIKSTEETTKKIKSKITEANQLATAIAQAAGKSTVRKAAAPTQSSVGAATMAGATEPTFLEKVMSAKQLDKGKK
jgi:hypothetical protein